MTLSNDRLYLLGLDVGSTTTSALVATARVGSRSNTGRVELLEPTVVYRADPVFTPLLGQCIDEQALAVQLDAWLDASRLERADLFAGGVIVTGLAARRQNAAAIATLVRARVGEAVMATADDPELESWLAFMGSCEALSRRHGTTPIVNLDIGGGTTNAALGRCGNVERTGCHFIGARHFEFAPGSYRLTAMSHYGEALLEAVGFRKRVGDDLDPDARASVIRYYVDALEAIVTGRSSFFEDELGRRLEQVPFAHELGEDVAVTFSGGVGELVYRLASGERVPGTTHYGDLGIDLAHAIVATPALARSLHSLVPEQRGRATVYGIALHATEVSGTTLYLPRRHGLPLRDLPILSQLSIDASRAELERALALARAASQGACLQFLVPPGTRSGITAADVRRLGTELAVLLEQTAFPTAQPLVLLLEPNAGKTLGQYASAWGRLAVQLLVIDEVPVRGARFVNVGAPRHQLVPVSYYGLQVSAEPAGEP